MGSSITSSGVASGIDFESIITSSVALKKQSLTSQVSKRKALAQVELTGIGKLKSTLSSFKDVTDKIAKNNSFNKRSVSITQDDKDPVYSVETKDNASNGNYNITVTQLSQSTMYSSSVADSTAKLGAGTLTFSVGSGDNAKTFEVEVDEEDTLETLRNKINQNSDNFGVSANILTLADGTSKFMLDSGITGEDYSNFTITSTGSSNLEQFNAGVTTDSNGKKVASGNMSLVRAGQDALIDVDGATLKSNTNVFDDTIKGLKLTVNRLSDTQTVTNDDGTTSTAYSSNKLSITTDKSALKDMMNEFITTYNSLRTNLDSLSKRDTYTDGECNNDGGYLAGDSTCNAIKSGLASILSNFKLENTDMDNVFSMGIKMDNDGNLSLDSEKFDKAVSNNFEQVVAAFSGKDGICSKMSSYVEDYTKSGGVLSKREDSLNSQVKDYERKEDRNKIILEKYETSLREKYSNLDSMIASLNTSLSYLSSAMASTSTSSKSS
ncbi:MAG: flagellar filament capping protein FliD [Ruminobacter sp.]|nr:flagellar filament capping protein FliD [Ruminobacter sp.]